jgi:hypothetical protein
MIAQILLVIFSVLVYECLVIFPFYFNIRGLAQFNINSLQETNTDLSFPEILKSPPETKQGTIEIP